MPRRPKYRLVTKARRRRLKAKGKAAKKTKTNPPPAKAVQQSSSANPSKFAVFEFHEEEEVKPLKYKTIRKKPVTSDKPDPHKAEELESYAALVGLCDFFQKEILKVDSYHISMNTAVLLGTPNRANLLKGYLRESEFTRNE